MKIHVVTITFLVSLIVAGSFSTSHGAPAGKFPPSVTICVNEGGATLNMMGNAIAAVLSDKLPFKINVRTISGGSSILIESGEVEIAMSVSVDSGQAFLGEAQYKGHAMPHLRLAVVGSPLSQGMAVRANSSIKTLRDLRGRKVAGDYKASPTQWWDVTAHLASVGMTWNDVSVVRVNTIGEALRALVEGRAEAANSSCSAGIAREANATIKGGIRFLPIDGSPEGAKRMWAAAPGYFPLVVQPEEGVGLFGPTPLAAKDVYVQVGSQVSPEVVYELTKGIASNLPAFEPRHVDFKLWKKEKFAKPSITIPYHDGAIRYFKEAGLWSAEAEKANAELAKKGK